MATTNESTQSTPVALGLAVLVGGLAVLVAMPFVVAWGASFEVAVLAALGALLALEVVL